MFGRYDIYERIKQLDPKDDCQEIVYWVGAYEYPWLIKKSLEFALFRTYAVPHTSRILQATGQFGSHGQKRYDDTTLMLAGIAEHGYDSEYGRKAIGRMNAMHGHWHIKNEDMLYVLSTFIYEPTRWHAKYGWRTPSRTEKLANYYFWVEVGKRMGIEDIPDSYEAYEQFNLAHEDKYFAYDDANRYIGQHTLNVFLNWYPAWLRPLVKEVALSFMDDRLREAFGFPKPHSVIRWTAHNALKFNGWLLQFFPPRIHPYLYTQLPSRTYPDGYDVEELGVHYDDDTDAHPASNAQ